MKWSMTMTSSTMQFNLEAENEHENELCKILNKFTRGEVSVHQGVNIGMNQVGFMREFSQPDKVCAITIRQKPVTLDPSQGIRQVGKAPGFDPVIRWFESSIPFQRTSSSVGQSTELLIRGSKVRTLPCPPCCI